MGSLCIGLFPSKYPWIPSGAPDPSVRDQHDPPIDECGNIHHRTIHTLSDTPNIYVKKHDQQPTTRDYNKLSLTLVGSMLRPSRKPLKNPPNGLSHLLDSP